MTQAEFLAQLDGMKDDGRGIRRVALNVAVGLNVALVGWLVAFHGRTHSPEAAHWGYALMGVWAVAIGTLLFSLKRYVRRNAPKCSECGRSLTWRERPQVLARRECPFCQSPIR
jgi:hypothetical protein